MYHVRLFNKDSMIMLIHCYHRVDIYRVAKDPIYVMKIFTVHLHSFVRKTRFRQYIIFKFRAVRLSRGQFMSRSLNYLEGGRVGPGFSWIFPSKLLFSDHIFFMFEKNSRTHIKRRLADHIFFMSDKFSRAHIERRLAFDRKDRME